MNIWELPDKELKKAARFIKEESRTMPKRMEPLPREHWDRIQSKTTRPIIGVWRSNRYLCQAYQESENIIRLSICRTVVDVQNRRWRDKLTWDEIQKIKVECGFGSVDAVEIYPRESDVVNVANMRHLFVMLDGVDFRWRSPNSLAKENQPLLKPGEL